MRNRAGKPIRSRLVLETLEDRCLPTAIVPLNFPIQTFDLPTPGAAPTAITAGPDGNLWFTEANADKIGRITPSGIVTEFNVPTAGAGPTGLTVGPDGNLWFTEINSFQIGRITTSGAISEFRLPSAGFKPTSITAGPDGALWFTEVNIQNPSTDQPTSTPPVFEPTSHAIFGGKIARITTTGAVSEFAIPTGADPNGTPNGITTGPDGNLWFTERTASDQSAIGRLTPAGAYTEFSITSGLFSQSGSITVGPNGNLWFSEPEYQGYIGRITPTGVVTDLVQGSTQGPRGVAVGGDGNVWVTNYDQMFGTPASITRVTPAGASLEFTLPDAAGGPFGLTADRNGNLWFTDLVHNKIVELPLSGSTSGAAATQTTLSVSALQTVFGQPVTLTASTASLDGAPTGNVTFFDGGAVLGSAPLDAVGQTKLSVSLAVGAHNLTAQFVGDAAFAASTSAFVSEIVNQASPTIAFTASASAVAAGQQVVFTAVLSAPTPGTAPPTGSVKFLDNGAVLATVGLDSNGRATFSTSFAAGDHIIEALYSGDGNFIGASRTVAVQVSPPVGAVPTTTVLSASANSVAVGGTVTFTAVVSSSSAAGSPTGSVTFKDGSVVLGTVKLDANGRATLSIKFTTTGIHTIKAVYSGDAEFAASSGLFTETVNKPRKWWGRRP
jgi:streptogramin lyase/plastocyanin